MLHHSEINYTADLISVFCSFSLNWEKEDFQQMFKDTSQGWEVFWNRFSGFAEHKMEVFFRNIPPKNQNMMVDYIYNVKHKTEMEGLDQNRIRITYLEGESTEKTVEQLQNDLEKAVSEQDFERAAILRDEIKKRTN